MSEQKEDQRLTAIDVCCGCGGATLGLKQAGFNVQGAIDVDPLAVKTYQSNHPEVQVWQADIRSLKPEEIAAELGLDKRPLDLLAGCPPCQGFSTIRTLNGAVSVNDSRNGLLLEFYRFVESFMPRAVMMENVPHLAKEKTFLLFCRNMDKLGYLGNYQILNAAQYGVPQRRYRLIYLAGHKHFIPFASPKGKMKLVQDVIRSLPKAGRSGDPLHDMPENRSPKVSELICRIPKNGGSRSDLPQEFQLECHKRCNGFKDVYGRMAWDDVAPTITSGCFNPSKGRFLHPEENRAITMREAALLQGFPKGYKFATSSKCGVASLIGNAFPPPFIAAHAMNVRKVIEGESWEE